ncbi:MAG: FAD-dependent thymidylate synthase [Chloroflexota bacterium]
MQPERRIYRLSPGQLSAETIAVTFAKTSRSPKAFDEIAVELNDEKSAQFNEKWVVGYGHASVAEHAVLHLALENVSRLAIETIEGNRLASYTEKSTRYQEWDNDAFIIPPEIKGSRKEKLYLGTCEMLFEAYQQALGLLRTWAGEKYPRQEDESEKAWQQRVRSRVSDVCRFLLPAAAMANVGVTINARALEYAIKKLLTSPLAEVRQIGEEVKAVALQELPTLVKYANPIEYLGGIQAAYKPLADRNLGVSHTDWCKLLEFDPEGEAKVLAALLYRFGCSSYQSCFDQVMSLGNARHVDLVDELFKDTGEFNVPLRELEYTSYVFDVIMDQGAYFEFKRHRMMSQTVQPLTVTLGFSMPRAFSEAGFEQTYIETMRRVEEAYKQLAAWNPNVAAYIVPNAFNRRIVFKLNLRELFHFSRLRCASNAHFSIRRVSRRMIEDIRLHHPVFLSHLCVDCSETSRDIELEYFKEVSMC